MRDEAAHGERFPAPRRAGDHRVPHIAHVQVEKVRRVMPGLEHHQGFLAEVWADACARIEREEEAQVRVVRLQQRQPTEVMRTVAGHD